MSGGLTTDSIAELFLHCDFVVGNIESSIDLHFIRVDDLCVVEDRLRDGNYSRRCLFNNTLVRMKTNLLQME